MTRLERQLIAGAIKKALDAREDFHAREGIKEAAGSVADALATWNQPFDKAEFLKLCGVESPDRFPYIPAKCPSKHWNNGQDICADCGTNLQD